MADQFEDYRLTLDGPMTSAVVVAPNDSADIANVSRAIYIGGTGNLNVVMQDGTTVLFSAIPVGTILPIRVTRVLSTSTTATLIVAMS